MRVILTVFLCLLIPSLAFGDFFVLYDKNTKEVINISDDEKDFIIAGSDKEILEVKEMNGSISDYGIDGAIQDYKLSGNKFIVNTKKISDRADAKTLDDEVSQERILIEQENINAAIDSLAAKGITLKHFTKK